MCRAALIQTITLDLPILKRKKFHATHASLSYLKEKLRSAAVFDCGEATTILARYQNRASIFIKEEEDLKAKILTLPNPNILITYLNTAGVKIAAFLTDAREMGLEMYIFRFDQSKGRWIWPLIGMRYGPSEENITKIGVYEPNILSTLSSQTQNSMVQEHSKEFPTITQALRFILETKMEPIEGAFQVVRKKPTYQEPKTRVKHKHKGHLRSGRSS
ncbi:MAG: hypothetical protein IJT59_07385 [Desulfovibrionaceae bacterium]|nr:hypothetical protein [Desulfovibrionaceae bacterium]